METFVRKPIRFHRNVIFSSRMRLPAFGAFGRMSSAGTSRRKPRQTRYVAPSAQNR